MRPIHSVLPIAALCTASPREPCSPANTTAAPSCLTHLIVIRGSFEAAGEGVLASLSTTLKQRIPGSTSEALVYPAIMPYSQSTPFGVTALKSRIEEYAAQCPQGKLVVLGYSQGAAVAVDTLCGGGGKFVDSDAAPRTEGLTAAGKEGTVLKAVVGMGDPRFVPGVNYEKGTNKDKGGIAKRDPVAAQCPAWAGRIVSYCDKNDSRCASGNSLEVHTSYTQRYTNDAIQFVLDKLSQA